MHEGSRTGSPVNKARSVRPFFVVFLGLFLVQMLAGCVFTSERPDIVLLTGDQCETSTAMEL